jgi:hypothetical protein
MERQAEVITREGAEDGGWLFTTAEGQRLRAWTVSLGTDLDAPNRRGRAYRFSPSRVAQRVLLASGERMGLLSDGEELRILLCDPARPDSHISIRLDRAGGWRAARALPDSYRLLLALASPAGVAALPELTEAARLAQSSVTKKLRLQARRAIEGFLQEVLEHPANAQALADQSDRQQLAKQLWSEGLITVYRLLFVFKLESSADPARAFSFAATSLWRNTYSPNTALAHWVRRVLDEGKDSGGFLEAGLRTLWRLFAEGMSSSELEIKPLGGMLFGRDATPLLGQLQWGEQAVARLLDALLWTPGEGVTMRERVHYGALDVEDLGRVYESLLELEPGISSEPMCRLRRAKLEVVVPVAQGNTYRSNPVQASDPEESGEDEEEGDEDEPAPTRGRAASGSKTKLEFIEEIAADRFFLRVGLGRKASGSYYTPHPFVRFLVQETLGVLLEECSPRVNPQPALILKLKVLDAAMGSGHFLVEACRFLGEGLYEACRLCDELAVQAEEQAEKTEGAERETLLAKAAELRKRVEDLPDPNNELLAYLPSRAAEGEESGLSQKKAEAMCRRLVAVHCLYGVDKNPLAVELAKLSLWLESYAEGLPLTFLDHRLICGDSLTGAFFENLLTYPKTGKPLDDLFAQELTKKLENTLKAALVHVRDLEASVGKDLADLRQKESAKKKLDKALKPLKILASAWSGGVMLGDKCDDTDYKRLAEIVASGQDPETAFKESDQLSAMIMTGESSIAYELVFPEVFYGDDASRSGFDAVLGNPPWNKIKTEAREILRTALPTFMSGKESGAVGVNVSGLRAEIDEQLKTSEADTAQSRSFYLSVYRFRREIKNANLGDPDTYQAFTERAAKLAKKLGGYVGLVLAGGFAKNPADRFLREGLAKIGGLPQIRYYSNAMGLFADLPQVIEFCLMVWSSGAKSKTLFWDDQKTFDSLSPWDSATIASEVILHNGFFSSDQPGSQSHNEISLSDFFVERGIAFGNDLHRTSAEAALENISTILPLQEDARDEDTRCNLLSLGYVPCYSGRSIAQHDSFPERRAGKWNPNVDLIANLQAIQVAKILPRIPYYRAAIRSTCGSPKSNQRSVVACILPPGNLTSHSLWCELEPWKRPLSNALLATAMLNSFLVDWQARPRVISNLSKSIMGLVMIPEIPPMATRFLVHSSVRLECVSRAHSELWFDQIGSVWRESTEQFSWPALKIDNERWEVRSLVDALIASSFGLCRNEYEKILSSFGHKSFTKAPFLCLDAFDDLQEIGMDEFARKHDPYWDIPLDESLPQPDSAFSIPEKVSGLSLGPLFDDPSAEVVVPAQPPIRVSASTAISPTRPTVVTALSTSTNGAFPIIAGLLHSRGVITSSDAQQATGLDAAGVRPHLQQLVQQGLAVTEGQRRGMRYRRVDG